MLERLLPKTSHSSSTLLSINPARKKVLVDLANTADVRRNFGMAEARPREGAAPLLCSQKTGIRADLRICLDVAKTVQNLEHQLRIDWLILVGSQAFPDHEPSISGECRARLVQAKQKISRDVHDINAIDKVEFSANDPLSAPRQIDVQRRPIQVEVWMLCCQLALI